jgi:hypothetical protein
MDFLHHILRPESSLTSAEKDDICSRCGITDGQVLSKNVCDKVCKELKTWWVQAPARLTDELICWCQHWQAILRNELDEDNMDSTLLFSDFSTYAGGPKAVAKPAQLHLSVRKHVFDDIFSASSSSHQKKEVIQYARLTAAVLDTTTADKTTALLDAGVDAAISLPQQAANAIDSVFVGYMVRDRHKANVQCFEYLI